MPDEDNQYAMASTPTMQPNDGGYVADQFRVRIVSKREEYGKLSLELADRSHNLRVHVGSSTFLRARVGDWAILSLELV